MDSQKKVDLSEINGHFVPMSSQTARLVEGDVHLAAVKDNFIAIGVLGDTDQFVDNLSAIPTPLVVLIDNDVLDVANARATVQVLRLNNEGGGAYNCPIEHPDDCVHVWI
jgi:hypothetical protein